VFPLTALGTVSYVTGRLGITDVSPVVSCGRYPARAVVGEHLPVAATVFREGHDAVAANVAWRGPDGSQGPAGPLIRMVPGVPGTDRWHATVVPTDEGAWTFAIEAWGDPVATWRHKVEVKIDAGQGPEDLANDLEDGARLLQRALRNVPSDRRRVLEAAAEALRDTNRDLAHRVGPALTAEVTALLDEHPVRELLTRSPRYTVWVDRKKALFSAWYELFPRSEGAEIDADGTPRRHGTFKDAARRLPQIAQLGFDVVYLPPIHPIGKVNRKGRNNTLMPGPEDVGSPWAIGSDEGGHDAIHPQLGTFEDFDDFVAATREQGMEVALDLALQAAPDHPWVTEHPEWFTTRPDGSIAYAENPPKKYQDIYPINFDNDPKGSYAEVLRIVRLWVGHGVKIFRVDNPHTKPLNFWHWLIWEVKKTDPDVLFLAEAFTRPAMMHALAKIGFSQSYTYFTWRTAKWELEEYGRELVAAADYMRPNFFVNTPDILHASLQHGGPPMFRIRALLAALMSPTWGVYSGYELFEHLPVREGSEEYLDSEKYQLRPRDYDLAIREGRSLAPYLAHLNRLRNAHPALQQLRNLRFHHVDNENLLAFSKRDDETGDTVIVVVTLNPYSVQEGVTSLDMPALGLDWNDRMVVHDEMGGGTRDYEWGQVNFVRLDPHVEPAHVLVVRR
jgi:starch synthase (maltosyl-transferring)